MQTSRGKITKDDDYRYADTDMYCLGCAEELFEDDSGLYCTNKKCVRCGLLTVLVNLTPPKQEVDK